MPLDDRSSGVLPAKPDPAVRRCANCGWENGAEAVKCGFCTALLVQPRKPDVLRSLVCPHCGADNLYGPRESVCSTCGKGLFQKPTAVDVGAARLVRAARGFNMSIRKALVLLLAAVAFISFSVTYRGYMKGVTADAIRQIKQRLLIFEGENGGFPESFETLDRRGLPIGPAERLDSWKNAIRYTVSEPFPKERISDFGGQLYGQAELRSAGPNGKFGDEDDLVWSGKAAP